MATNTAINTNRLSVALVLADEVFSAEVQAQLLKLGFLAWTVPNAKELYKRLLSDNAEILVIDITDTDNLDAIKHLGSLNKYLITAIGPQTIPNLEIEVLSNGADRYLRTPLNYDQLLVNINAMIKYLPDSVAFLQSNLEPAWQLNSKRMVLNTPNSIAINLTFCEFILLKLLLQNPGKPVACDVLMSNIYPHSDTSKRRDIHMLIYRFRRKIHETADLTIPIQSSHSNGYLFTENALMV